MKKTLSLFLALFMIFAYSPFVFAAENTEFSVAENNMEFATKVAEIIKDDDNNMLRIIGKLKKTPSDNVFSLAEETVISQDGRFVLQFSNENDLLLCLDKLNSSPDIIYAERDITVYTQAVEDDGYLSWGVEAIEADIYSETINPAPDNFVTVAIIDSGCEDIDFIKDKLIQGYDFADNDSDATHDESVDSHGTFLASIVADCTRNLPVNIMPVRVLNSKSGSVLNVINGIMYAADNGADIINISLGAVLNNCQSLEDAVNYAESKNVTVVVCAGNSKIDIEKYCPAHNSNAITVTSIDMYETFSSSFSNFGNEVDVAAPGEIIIGYNASGEKAVLSGTSMSAAFVSAATAMFRLKNPACNTNQVRKAIIDAAEDRGDEGRDIYYGHGVLKLGNLINSTVKYVESVSLPQNTYELFVGDTLTIEPIFSPADATDKTFSFSVFGSNISIDGSTITAVSAGISTLTVTSNDGEYIAKAQITVKEKPPEITAVLKIKNNPVTKTINYGETLRLTAEVTDRPENSFVWWYVNGTKNAEGETFEILPQSGSVTITAKLVDTNGNAILNSQGNEISDSETVTVNSGFFQKLISFFKNLFGINRTVIQYLFKVY